MHADLVILGGTLVDGTGAAPRPADVSISNGVITAITAPGSLAPVTSGTRLDATGSAVAPGFIDAHAHSDLAMFLPDEWHALAVAPLRQGVTTEVCGNCGESPFPRTDLHGAASDEFTRLIFQVGLDGFTGLDAYARHLAGTALPTHQAPLLGHGMLRAAAMGLSDRAPTSDEMALMERLTAQAFEEGAFGLSTGLIYTPGQFARTEEITRLAAVAARFGAPYVTHMRDEADHVNRSVSEALAIGEAAGSSVHISHHKVAGRQNWGRSSDTLAMLTAARETGRDVTVDIYPYTAGSTGLHALLPPWVAGSGIGNLLRHVADAVSRDRLGRDFATGLPGWQNLIGGTGWDNVVVAGSPSHPELEGMSIGDAASASGQSEIDTVCQLVRDDEARTIVVLHMMSEDDVDAIRAWDGAMLGSDGVPLPGKPHPRIAGTFAKALKSPANQDPWARLADRVHRMTGLPAKRYRIPGGRGELAVGHAADIVIFDPVRVTDRATYTDPLLPPTGIEHVVVGGTISVRSGNLTGRYAGQVLRAR